MTSPVQQPATAKTARIDAGSPATSPAVRRAVSRWLGGRAAGSKEAALVARRLAGFAWIEELRSRLPLLIVAVPVLFNAVTLLPELTIPVANINDDAFHWAFIHRGIDALQRGENVLEFWVPQVSLGFPQFLYYQHLPHIAVILLHRALFGVVDAYALFNLVRYLLLVALPVTVFWSLRRMELPFVAAAFGAAASSLLSTDHLYGFDYDSYVWRGFGMYTQLWAMHLSFITLACLYRLINSGRGHLAAALSLSALAISHILYGYMAVITAGVIFLVGITRPTVLPRLAHLAFIGACTTALTSYMWVPNLSASVYLDRSPYLEQWKYDSFGAPRVLELLLRGELFDHGRLPVFTALVMVGIVAALLRRSRPALIAVGVFTVWLVLYFGRPTLGLAADLLPLSASLYFHRFIGGVHLAGILLIGLAGSWLWDQIRRMSMADSWLRQRIGRIGLADSSRWERTRPVQGALRMLAVAALLGLVLLPAFVERSGYYAQGADWMRQTNAAIQRDEDARQILAKIASLPPGRTYAGLRANWGAELNFGLPFNSVRFFNLLTYAGLPEVATPYSGPSLNADLLYDFDERRPEHFDLFDARYVVAPSSRRMPDYLQPILRTARYTLYEAPTSGYAEYVAIGDRRDVTTQARLFPQNRAWLASADVAAKRFIRWDYPSAADGSTGAVSPGCERGSTRLERVQPGRLELEVECGTPSALALKVTYHPNWQVTVDGSVARTFMVSPSYVGVELAAGRHLVIAEYRSTPSKVPLLALGALGLVLAVAGGRWLDRRNG